MEYCSNCKAEMKKVESTEGPFQIFEFAIKYKCTKCGYTKTKPVDFSE